MKIAVASTDGQALSPHFGRSRCFVVFTVEDTRVLDRQVRDNTFTAHAQGRCDGSDAHPHDAPNAHDTPHTHDAPHGHADILAALHDCHAVLCGGMGARAAHDLQAHGIRPIAFGPDAPDSVEEALAAFLSGRTPSGPFCCHH